MARISNPINPIGAAAGATDGWTDANETWAYASATTITVPSGAASKYQKGDKIKWTQTTVKYGVIVGVADTVLTIAVNTDYVVTNAAISANYYSHQVNPMGYPTWFNYTPTYGASGSMTWTSVTANPAKFKINGKSCTVVISASGTTGGTASTVLTVTLPVTPDNTTYRVGGSVDDGVGYPGWFGNYASIGTIYCSRWDNGNFGLGAGRAVYFQMTYGI